MDGQRNKIELVTQTDRYIDRFTESLVKQGYRHISTREADQRVRAVLVRQTERDLSTSMQTVRQTSAGQTDIDTDKCRSDSHPSTSQTDRETL